MTSNRSQSLYTTCSILRWFLLCGATTYAAWRAWTFTDYSDFEVYYRQGEKLVTVLQTWITGSGPLPELSPSANETSPFRYSPLWGWLFAPIALLPFQWAKTSWVVSQWIFYILSLKKLEKTFHLNPIQSLIIFIGTARFAVDNSNIGQISCLLSWLVIYAVLSISPFHRSLFLALAASIKLYPAALFFIPLLRKDWKFLKSAFAACGLVGLASLSWGWKPFEIWLSVSSRAEQILYPSTIGNQSLYGTFLRQFGEGNELLARIVFVTALLICVAYFYRMWKTRWNQEDRVGWIFAIACLPIFGILTWKNTYVLWALPLGYLIRTQFKTCVLIAALFGLSSQGIVGSHWNLILLHHGFLPWCALIGTMFLSSIGDTQPQQPPLPEHTVQVRAQPTNTQSGT